MPTNLDAGHPASTGSLLIIEHLRHPVHPVSFGFCMCSNHFRPCAEMAYPPIDNFLFAFEPGTAGSATRKSSLQVRVPSSQTQLESGQACIHSSVLSPLAPTYT